MVERSESFSRDDVIHVALLARLNLTDDEIDMYASQLGSILDHVAAVTALETSDVAPTAHPLEILNVLRPDEIGATLARDEVLAQAPAAESGRYKVPPILGEAP